ncbi:hypothetical protein MSTO_04930 [Mycobacterium stomatepiae]|uniref:Uncharacterized protein n=1 Tax=Mycobacterium stomatepiae TaxID=470076 RepID=A0A7I7Q1Y9_9MYCO|nr:hypothetical protein [Mycobacterium stomatepiae]BBY20288.1 hypothetical protein MSTO_04930 [Mycobacterium stomatepiae]
MSLAPKKDLTRTTAKPPTTTTATIRSGNQAFRTIFDSSNYVSPFLVTVVWPAPAQFAGIRVREPHDSASDFGSRRDLRARSLLAEEANGVCRRPFPVPTRASLCGSVPEHRHQRIVHDVHILHIMQRSLAVFQITL